MDTYAYTRKNALKRKKTRTSSIGFSFERTRVDTIKQENIIIKILKAIRLRANGWGKRDERIEFDRYLD